MSIKVKPKIENPNQPVTQTEIDQIMGDFDKLKSAITVAAPFISSLLRRLKITVTRQIPTASVDRNGVMRINPDFFLKLDNRDKAWVIGHETMHIAFRDVSRGKNANPWLFNVSCDGLNNNIQEGFFRASENINSWAVTVERIFYELQDAFFKAKLNIEDVKAMTKEELYEFIKKLADSCGTMQGKPKCPVCGSEKIRITNLDLKNKVAYFKCDACGHTWKDKIEISPSSGGSGGGSNIPIDKITGIPDIMQDLDKSGDGSNDQSIQDGDPELYDGQAGNGQAGPEQDEKWKDAVLRAYTAQKLAGKVPAGLQKLIDKMLKARVNWKDVLRQTCRVGLGKTFVSSWRRPHRKIEGFPGSHRFTLPRVWCLVDQSGSIYDKETEQFLGEMFEISKNTTLNVVCWDAEAYDIVKADSPKDVMQRVSKRMRGGGGTCIQPVLKKTLANMKPQDIVVVFTDGEIYDITESETKSLMNQVAFKAAAAVFATTQREHEGFHPKWVQVKVKVDKRDDD